MRTPGEEQKGFTQTSSDHGVWEFDPARGEITWSESLYRIHGVDPATFEPTMDSIAALIHPDDFDEYRHAFRAAIAERKPFTHQHRVVLPDGSERVLVVRGAFIGLEAGGQLRVVGTTQDVTGREGVEERLWHLANYDALSGLYNRRRFMEELQREVAIAARRGEPGAVLMLDLDRFKDVNDSLGHRAGDGLLARVAEALRDRLRATDTLARLGGDEFALVLPSCPIERAERVAAQLVEAIGETAVRIAGFEHRVSASVGIAGFGAGELRSAEELMIEADLAMYRAKRERRGGVEVFDQEMRAELAARVTLESELRRALREDELEVHFQPIVSLRDGVPVGCEALVRWTHPERGPISPAEFIPVAEESGAIREIGALVLARACEQGARWRREGRHLFVSVNASPLEIVTGDIVGAARRALAASRLPPPLLCVEITETSLLSDNEPLRAALRELRELGVRVSIDDFGGGASSLGLLRLLPVDQIKIDRMFIEGLAEHPDDRAIVAAVLSLAEELELTVVAEGVETERQQGQLRELGCQFAQGFLYSRARPAPELELAGYSSVVQPGVGDPLVIREFMRQIGIPARVGA